MKISKITLVLLLAVLGFSAKAQISHGGTPPGLVYASQLNKQIATVEMPAVDVATLMLEDEQNEGKDQPYRFGFNHSVNLNMQNSGVWTTLKKGEKVWRLGIKCPGAYSINLILSKFNIPQGAQLFLYNTDHTYILGSFTKENMQDNGELGIDLIPGEEIVVEYIEPAKPEFAGQISIGQVTHAYRDVFKLAKDLAGSGNCHNNVICPVGLPWADQIRSVAMMVVNGNGFCTGSLVNNTANDGTPYFLSAYHCGTNAANWVFRFNYNSTNCGNDAGGITTQSVSGAVLRAGASSSDFTLFELNSTPPANYNVYYAGWNRSNISPTSGASIHHPSGDLKKISFITQTFDSTQWTGNGVENHWFVQWSSGVTEGGSSGSPLFDQNKRVVGQLHGGASYCGAPTNSLNDEYGKFFYSWNKIGNGPTTQLKTWLDPQNTGAETIDGFDPNGVLPTVLDASASALVLPTGLTCISSATPSFTVTNTGGVAITTLSINYVLDGGAPQNYVWTGALAAGASTSITMPQITFSAGAHTYTATIATVNGIADDDANNNSVAGNFTSSTGTTYTINLTADDYGNETALYILSLQGDTIFSVDTGTVANNATVNFSVCLPDACYQFVITDAYGDGICCSAGDGSFELVNGQGQVVFSGGQFGFSTSSYFCVPTPANNAVLVSIASPTGTYCKDTAIPELTIANQGSTTLTSLTINYRVDNGTLETFNWTGSLALNQSATITLPAISFAVGNHTFTAYTSAPNGQPDGFTLDDTLTSTFNYVNGTVITFNLTTDEYPDETAWILTTDPGNAILYESASPNGYGQSTAYSTEFCLPDGCYTFSITDTEGDGICCDYGDGSFNLVTPDEAIIASGGQFTNTFVIDFCLPFVSVPEQAAPEFSIYPNPANGSLFLNLGKGAATLLRVDIINAQGQLIQSVSTQNAPIVNLNVEGYATGLYLVRVYGENTKPATATVIIKN